MQPTADSPALLENHRTVSYLRTGSSGKLEERRCSEASSRPAGGEAAAAGERRDLLRETHRNAHQGCARRTSFSGRKEPQQLLRHPPVLPETHASSWAFSGHLLFTSTTRCSLNLLHYPQSFLLGPTGSLWSDHIALRLKPDAATCRAPQASILARRL